jgi:hypothetical protein
VSGVLVSKEKNLLFFIIGVFLAFFPLFIDAALAIGGLLLATLSLGCHLLLSTMLGTIFRVYSMLLNIEIK